MASGGGGLDPIDLTGQKRGDPRRGFRHRQQDDAVLLGDAVVVPVIRILDELEPLVRHGLVELVGPVPAGAFAYADSRCPHSVMAHGDIISRNGRL